MGIQNLNKNLKACEVFNQRYDNIISDKELIYHVDFSIMLYDYLSTSKNMTETINKFIGLITKIKKKNIIHIYIDPIKNERKTILHNKRLIHKKNEITKIKNTIKKDLFSNKILNNNKFNMLNLNQNEPIIQKLDYNEYLNNIDILNQNLVIDSCSDYYDYHSFKLFYYSNNFVYHRKYILNHLLTNNIIDENEIIYSSYSDAEIEIIKIIKDNYNYDEYKNIILTKDQDIILFYSLHINSKYMFLQNGQKTNTIINNNLTKNISILTLIFNESDYFPGIRQFSLTDIKLVKLFKNNPDSLKILNYDYQNNILCLCASFLKLFENNFNSYIIENDIVDNYFNNIQLYFNMDNQFFQEEKINLKIHINNLYYYFRNNHKNYITYDGDKFINKNY